MVGDFQFVKDVFGVEIVQEFEDCCQQYVVNEDGDNVQFWFLFIVKDQYVDDWGKWQNGIQCWGGGGDVVDIEYFVRNVFFFIQIVLLEKVGDCYVDNSCDGDWQCGFKSKVDQWYFSGFGCQDDVI